MKYTNEEELFNIKFSDPVIYILYHNNKYILNNYISHYPLRVYSIEISENIENILEIGKKYSDKEGIKFLNNEIFI